MACAFLVNPKCRLLLSLPMTKGTTNVAVRKGERVSVSHMQDKHLHGRLALKHRMATSCALLRTCVLGLGGDVEPQVEPQYFAESAVV